MSIAVALIMPSFFVPADAATTSSSEGKIYPYCPQVELYYSDVEDYIADCIRNYDKSIDLSSYNVHKDDLMTIFRAMCFDNPDIFYVNSAYVEYVYDSTGRVYSVEPVYIYTRSKLDSYVSKFKNTANKLIKDVDLSWSGYKKALAIHDILATTCVYKDGGVSYCTAYKAIVDHKGVCEAYSRAYSYLLKLVGVDSKCINSSSLSHCWNMVKLGGKWYHVDVTKDDPLPDISGYVRHTYFLCSDSYLLRDTSSDAHSGWTSDVSYSSDYKCSSTKYDNSYFKNIKSVIICKNSAYYYIKNNYKNKNMIALIKRKNGNKKVICKITAKWYKSNGNLLTNTFSELCCKGKYLYFNTSRNVYRLKIGTKKAKSVYTIPPNQKKDFYGIKLSGNYIIATKKKSDTQTGSTSKIIYFNGSKLIQMPYINSTSVSIKKGSSYKLKVYRGSGKVTYKSSNTKIAKVNSKGKIKGLKKGNCTITAVKNGKSMKCKVTVK